MRMPCTIETAKSETAMQRYRSTSTHVRGQVAQFVSVLMLCLTPMETTGICTEDPTVLSLVGVGATLPKKVYEDALWIYQRTMQKLQPCYHSQGSGSAICRMKGWLPANCTLDCVEGMGCIPCHSDCSEWEATGKLSAPEEADFGATDMILTDEDYEEAPGLQLIPTMTAALVPVYNLGGMLSEPLVVDRHVLPLIFSGNLTRWNDARLKALQPSHVADVLPDEPIEVVVRGDTSGSTHIWKSALMAFSDAFRLDQEGTGSTRLGDPDWGNAARFQPTRQIGTGGVAGHMLNQPYTFGYMVLNEAKDFQLEMASFVHNENGVVVQASSRSLTMALLETSFQWAPIADVLWSDTSAAAGDLINGLMREITTHTLVDTTHPSSWPISGYTYIIVNKDARSSHMKHRTCESHRAMVEFWRWFLANPLVEDLMAKQDFAPLPEAVVTTLLSWLESAVRCDGELSAIQLNKEVVVRGSVPHDLSYEFDLMGPSYEAAAQVDLELTTHEFAQGEAAWETGTLAFMVSIGSADHHEDTEKDTNLMWKTFALAVLVNLDGITAQSTVRMTIETLASILSGHITRWDDPALVADNLELVGVSHKILPLSIAQNATKCEPLLEEALHHGLQRNVSCNPSHAHSSSFVQVLEKVSNTPFSLAVLPMMGSLGERIGNAHQKGEVGIVKLRDIAHTLDYVLPTRATLLSCVSAPDVAEDVPRSCYPLHLHTFVRLKKDYGPNCMDSDSVGALLEATSTVNGEQGEAAVKFWSWEFSAFHGEGVATDSLALQPVNVHSIGPEWKAHRLAILEQVGCNGVSFLKPNKGGGVQSLYFVLLLCFGGIMVLILAATAFTCYKNMRLSNRLEVMHEERSRKNLDLDSPILKVIQYLEAISAGKPVDVDIAQQLATMLHHADNFDRPDLQHQLASDSYNSEIVRYLMANTTRVTAADDLKNRTSQEMMGSELSLGFVSDEDTESAASSTRPVDVVHVQSTGEKCIPLEKQVLSPTTSSSKSVDNKLISQLQVRSANKRPSTLKLGKVLSVARLGSLEPFEDEFCSVEDQNNPRLSNALKTIGVDYFYDVLELDKASKGRPLTCATVFLFQRMGLIMEFNIDKIKLERYMTEIEQGYLSENAYHNAIHAADVVQRTCTILTHCCSRFLSKLQILSALLAAAIHDLRHPGTTNAHHVTTSNPLAMRFNDQHVLENHSLVLALGLLRRPGYNFLENMTDFETRKVRSTVIDMVLGTDLSMHFELLSKFQSKVTSKRHEVQFDDKAISLIMQMTLKCADIGHCTLPYRQHLYWVTCLQNEFFQQGDTEKEMDMKVSPLMDRDKPGPLHRENQIGFLDVIVLPLFAAFGDALDGLQPMRDQLNVISAFWKSLEKNGEVLERPLSVLREQLSSHQALRHAQGVRIPNKAETVEDVLSEYKTSVVVRVPDDGDLLK